MEYLGTVFDGDELPMWKWYFNQVGGAPLLRRQFWEMFWESFIPAIQAELRATHGAA